MMGTHKGVNEAHFLDAILEASQEHLGDQIMEKMVFPWMHSSLSPKRNKHIVQYEGIRCNEEIFESCIVHCRECVGRQQ